MLKCRNGHEWIDCTCSPEEGERTRSKAAMFAAIAVVAFILIVVPVVMAFSK